jgi:hypothetical protein
MKPLLAILWFISANSVAATACLQTDKNEYSNCLDEQIVTLERELEVSERTIKTDLEAAAKLNGRSGPIEIFVRSRREYRKYVASHCQWQYLTQIPNSLDGAILFKECTLQHHQQQIAELSALKIH